MKKVMIGIFGFIVLISFVFVIQGVSADACALSTKLISQDPYPAIPGEEMKVVFQVNGLGNPQCGQVTLTFVEKFPFTLVPGQSATVTAQGGQVQNFGSFLLAPFKVKVNADALDGDNALEIKYASSQGSRAGSFTNKEFNISVEDVRTDFEVSIKDYVKGTQTLTFEILNTGEHDVEALTIDIPKQDNIAVKGSSRNIVGSLDSNEDTTFSFEAIPKNGEINLVILYTDEINVRRQLEKSVVYDSSYFTGRARDSGGTGTGTYIIIFVIIVAIVWYFWRRHKKKKEAHRKKHLHH
jgi:hypothetical protein